MAREIDFSWASYFFFCEILHHSRRQESSQMSFMLLLIYDKKFYHVILWVIRCLNTYGRVILLYVTISFLHSTLTITQFGKRFACCPVCSALIYCKIHLIYKWYFDKPILLYKGTVVKMARFRGLGIKMWHFLLIPAKQWWLWNG